MQLSKAFHPRQASPCRLGHAMPPSRRRPPLARALKSLGNRHRRTPHLPTRLHERIAAAHVRTRRQHIQEMHERIPKTATFDPDRSSPRHPCPNKLSHVTLKPEVRAASPTARAVPMRRNKPEAGLVQPAPERPPALRIAREAGYGLRCTERTRTRPGHLAPQTARTKSEAAMDPQDLTQELRNEPERRRAHPFTAPQRQPPDDPALGGKPDQTPFSSTLSLRRACHGSARKP